LINDAKPSPSSSSPHFKAAPNEGNFSVNNHLSNFIQHALSTPFRSTSDQQKLDSLNHTRKLFKKRSHFHQFPKREIQYHSQQQQQRRLSEVLTTERQEKHSFSQPLHPARKLNIDFDLLKLLFAVWQKFFNLFFSFLCTSNGSTFSYQH